MTEFFLKNILAEELFGSRICESLEDKWVVDFLYEQLMLEKFLYGEPITVPELRKILRKKILNFEFIKLNGEVRPAKGTTMMKYIPPKDHPKGIRPSSPKVATFFDLDKEAWRSVSQRSKEIVLKKDEEKGRPIVVVRDIDQDAEKDKQGKPKEPRKPKVTDVEPVTRSEEEPVDELKVGDVRDYLNRRGENVQIEIIDMDPDGGIYAKETMYGAVFKIPSARIQNIGEPVEPENISRRVPKPIAKKVFDVEPKGKMNIPAKSKEETILIPLPQAPSKEPPKDITTEEEPDSEELES